LGLVFLPIIGENSTRGEAESLSQEKGENEMAKCLWCGSDYEWTDRLASALCESCASGEAQDYAAEAKMEEALWGAEMAEEISALLSK